MGVTDVSPVLSTSRRCCSAPGLAADGRSGGGPAQALWPRPWVLGPQPQGLLASSARLWLGAPGRCGGPRQEGEATRVGEATGCWPGSASQTCPPSPHICGTHLQPRTFARTNLLAVSSSALLPPHPCGSLTRPLPAQPQAFSTSAPLCRAFHGHSPSPCFPRSVPTPPPPRPPTEELNTAVLDHRLQGLGTGVPSQAPALERACHKQMKH